MITNRVRLKIIKRFAAAFIALFLSVFLNTVNAQTMKFKPILFVVSSDEHGYWLPEVVEPYYMLSRAGFKIDIASPLGGKGVQRGVNRMSNHYNRWYQSSILVDQLESTLLLSEVSPLDYQAVYFAGGAGPMFDLIDNKTVHDIIRNIYENNGLIAADCHGPAALVNATLSDGERLIKGKNITAKANKEEGIWARMNYPFLLEDKIRAVGGNYSSAKNGKPHVVTDGRIITGQNPASAILVAKHMLAALIGMPAQQKD